MSINKAMTTCYKKTKKKNLFENHSIKRQRLESLKLKIIKKKKQFQSTSS